MFDSYKFKIILILLLALFSVKGDYVWNDNATGDHSWNNPGNWTPGVPTNAAPSHIDRGDPYGAVIDAFVSGEAAAIARHLYVAKADNTLGALYIEEGGELVVSYDFLIADSPGSEGYFNMSGGTVSIGRYPRWGGYGSAYANITGGIINSVSSYEFYVGLRSGGYGEVNMSGGVLNTAGHLRIGHQGPGQFLLSNTGQLNIGGNIEISTTVTGEGVLTANGGSISCNNLYVGYENSGSLILDEANTDIEQKMIIGLRSSASGSEVTVNSGVINISGSEPGVNGLRVGNEGDGILVLNGGEVNIGADLSVPYYAAQGSGSIELNDGKITTRILSVKENGHIDISSGRLIVEGDIRFYIKTLVESGNITGFGGSGKIIYDYDNLNSEKTTVYAVESNIYPASISIDDFEIYTSSTSLKENWGSSAQMEIFEAPYNKVLRLDYDNQTPDDQEFVERPMFAMDLTAGGIGSLAISYRGDQQNGLNATIFVTLKDRQLNTATVKCNASFNISREIFTQWNIPLWKFTKQNNIQLSDIYTIKIGVCGVDSGSVYIDDVVLFNSRMRERHNELDVRSFGALPDDSVDDGVAIQNAIDAANNGDVVFLPGGVYNLSSDNLVNRSVLNILNKENIKITGSDPLDPAVLMLDGMDGCYFYVDNSSDIHFENIIFDSIKPGFIQGTIESRGFLDENKTYVDIAVNDLFEPTLNKVKLIRRLENSEDGIFYTQNPFTISYRNENGNVPSGDIGFDTSMVGDLLRIEIPAADDSNTYYFGGNFEDDMTVGTELSMLYRVYDYYGIYIEDSENISFRDVEVFLTNGVGLKARRGANLAFDNFRYTKKPGYVATTSADGIQTEDIAGQILFDNCRLAGTCDDAIALHNKFLYVKSVENENSFTSIWGVPGPARPAVGEKIEILSSQAQYKGTATLTSVVYNGEVYIMTADFEWVTPGLSIEVDDILDILDRIPERVEVFNSEFRSLRGMGIRMRTRNAIVDNCTFERTTSPAISLDASFYNWMGGPVASDILISNSNFIQCPYWFSSAEGAVVLTGKLEDNSAGPSSLFSNVAICNNIFESAPNCLLYLESNNNIVVADNILRSSSLSPEISNGDAAIYFDNAKRITLKGNEYAGEEQSGIIRWTESCDLLYIDENSNFVYENKPVWSLTADYDNDGVCNLADLSFLSEQWFEERYRSESPELCRTLDKDLNNDCVVNIDDLLIIVAQWLMTNR